MQEKDLKSLQLAEALGDVIKQTRLDNAKLSLDRLANSYGINKGTLSTLENGLFNAKFITIWKISEALGIKCSELVRLLEDRLGEEFTLIDE